MALRRNILIFHQGALGDFVVTWPLALALARLHPQSRVFYVTHGQKGALAERVLRVESSDVEAGWHRLFGDDPSALPERPARLLAGAHTVVSFVSGPGDAWARNVAALAPEADALFLSPRPPDDATDFRGHVTEWLLGQLGHRPALREAAVQILRSVADRGVLASRTTGDAVVIHPGAGSPSKLWPAGRFAELAALLRADGLRVVTVVGEAETDERWNGGGGGGGTAADGPVTTPKDLVELSHLLAGARAFVGNDSGPGHLAGILGVPTVSLFGRTDPDRWRPLGPRVRVIKSQALEALEAAQVYDVVREVIAK